MRAQDLRPEQVESLAAILSRHATFYSRLVRRMERVGFPPADPVYQRAVTARHSVSALLAFVREAAPPQARRPALPPQRRFDPASDDVSPNRMRARRREP